ncbi:MAG TPA: hypothetical protein VFF39_00030, partial [Verrucomicrobiae bacterium]|nr:hypothetical protein [Verrucomicrobiae bacterium]
MSFTLTRLSRRACSFFGVMVLLWLLQGHGFAQAAGDTTQPIEAAGGFLQSQGAQPKFEAASKLSNDARTAMREGRVFSVPHFSGSFALQGNNYPYTMVGSKPQSGGSTEVPVQIVPISMFFEEFVDENGSPIVIDPSPVMPRIQASPNFRTAQYQNG